MANNLPMMLVKAAVKEVTKKEDVNVAGDFFDKLNTEVAHMVRLAVQRCKANGRKTVRATDL